MTKLEDKILKDIYVFETKRTIVGSVVNLVLSALLLGMIFLTGQVIYEILVEEGAFDLFQIVQEDFEVLRMYAGDTVYVFFQEIPKELGLVFLISVIILVVLVFIVINHFGIIKNKFKALARFWGTHP